MGQSDTGCQIPSGDGPVTGTASTMRSSIRWVSTGKVTPNASICSTSKFETPTWRIFPSAISLASACAVSSKSLAGSGQCNWYRSM